MRLLILLQICQTPSCPASVKALVCNLQAFTCMALFSISGTDHKEVTKKLTRLCMIFTVVNYYYCKHARPLPSSTCTVQILVCEVLFQVGDGQIIYC